MHGSSISVGTYSMNTHARSELVLKETRTYTQHARTMAQNTYMYTVQLYTHTYSLTYKYTYTYTAEYTYTTSVTFTSSNHFIITIIFLL